MIAPSAIGSLETVPKYSTNVVVPSSLDLRRREQSLRVLMGVVCCVRRCSCAESHPHRGDDSVVIRKILHETLGRELGWEVCGEASNGREGIAKAQQLKPDLIVLDLAM